MPYLTLLSLLLGRRKRYPLAGELQKRVIRNEFTDLLFFFFFLMLAEYGGIGNTLMCKETHTNSSPGKLDDGRPGNILSSCWHEKGAQEKHEIYMSSHHHPCTVLRTHASIFWLKPTMWEALHIPRSPCCSVSSNPPLTSMMNITRMWYLNELLPFKTLSFSYPVFPSFQTVWYE